MNAEESTSPPDGNSVPPTLITTGSRYFARLLELPISQDLADRWHTIAMTHLLINQTTKYAAIEPALDCFTLYNMLEGTALFSMKFGQCPVPVDLLAVKSNTFSPPCPPDLGRNTVSQQLHFSLLDWQMTAADELDQLRAQASQLDNNNNNIIYNFSSFANSSSSVAWAESFLKEAEAELTKLIGNPRRYDFRNPENVSTKLAVPSFGVEGFASAVFWLCVVRQAKAESKQNADINAGSPIQHHKRHRYDAEVGDFIWKQALIDVMNPNGGFLEVPRQTDYCLSSTKKQIKNEGNNNKIENSPPSSASNLGDVLLKKRTVTIGNVPPRNVNEKDEDDGHDRDRDRDDEQNQDGPAVASSFRQRVVSVSKIVQRVGGKVDPDASGLFKLLLTFSSSEMKAEQEKMAAAKKKKLESEKYQKRRQSLIASFDDENQDVTSLSDFWETKLAELKTKSSSNENKSNGKNRQQQINNTNNNISNKNIDDTISLEDAMHLLCVKRVSDLDDGLIDDLEKWCLRRVSLWIMQRFSPLHFPSQATKTGIGSASSSLNGGENDALRKYYRPYLLRCFFKIVSTAVARLMTRLFNGTVTGTEISQHDMWITVREKSVASTLVGGNKNKTSSSTATMNIPPEVMHAKMLQTNVEKMLLEIASLPTIVSGAKCIFTGASSSTNNNNHHHNQQPSTSRPSSARVETSSSFSKTGASFRSVRLQDGKSSSNKINDGAVPTSKKEDQYNNDHNQQDPEIIPDSPSSSSEFQPQPPQQHGNINLKHQLQENIRQALHERKALGKKPQIILTDDVAAVRKAAAQRAAARKRTVALTEGEYTNNNFSNDDNGEDAFENGEGDAGDIATNSRQNNNIGNPLPAHQQQQQQRRQSARYIGWNLADKGIAIGDDSDYRKNLTTPSAINRMMLSIGASKQKHKKQNKGGVEHENDDDDDDGEHEHEHEEPGDDQESAQEIMSTLRQRVGATTSSTSAANEELKNQQMRALASRQAMRDVIDADRRALASHFGDLKSVVSEMDKARMTQLLRLQGASGHPTSSILAQQQQQQQQQQQNEMHKNKNGNNSDTNSRKKSLLEIQLEAKAAAAAKVNEMYSNRPHSARIFASTRNKTFRMESQNEVPYSSSPFVSSRSNQESVVAFHGLSQGAISLLRDPEEIVGHVAPIRPKERVLHLTPRGTSAVERARKTIRGDLQSCLARTAVADQLTEAEVQEQTALSITKHFKRNLSDQSQADLARSVSVLADRVRADNARKRSERTYERHHFIAELQKEVATLNISPSEIGKRCTTGIRTQEYYSALHSCKLRIDTELAQKGFEYLIKERNVLRDLAMVVHRMMATVRRNFSEHVDEFEEFELRRKGLKNFAVKREAEYL